MFPMNLLSIWKCMHNNYIDKKKPIKSKKVKGWSLKRNWVETNWKLPAFQEKTNAGNLPEANYHKQPKAQQQATPESPQCNNTWKNAGNNHTQLKYLTNHS